MARTAAREHEFAIRGALGAARSLLMQQLLVESVLLALCGGALAILFAWVTDRYLLQFLANREAAAALSVRPDLATLAITGGCAAVCALLFGLAPGWLASHISIEPPLRRSAQNVAAGRSAVVQRIFVPAQAALTLALVVVAAMMSATVSHLRAEHLGFRVDNILLIPVDFERRPQKGPELVHLYRRMVERIRQMPGVDSASVALSTPLHGMGQTAVFTPGVIVEAGNRFHQSLLGERCGCGLFRDAGNRGCWRGTIFRARTRIATTWILNRFPAANALFHASPAIGQTLRRTNRNP